MKKNNYKALGQGLSALINDKSLLREDLGHKVILSIPIKEILPNSKQPRQAFAETELRELAESIASYGVIQPILLQKEQDNVYRIIAGERRWRAAALANLQEIPAIIRENNLQENIELSIIENIQRQDLNPIEEANAYAKIIDEYNYTHTELAKKIGKSRSYITNYIRLTTLDDALQKLIIEGDISVGHAKLLLTAENPKELINQILTKKLSVKELQNLVAQKKATKVLITEKKVDRKGYDDLEKMISEKLSIDAKLKTGKQGGELVLKFTDFEQLDQIISLLFEHKNLKF